MPEPRQPPPRLRTNGRRAHELGGPLPCAVDRASGHFRDGRVGLAPREPEEERELDEHERAASRSAATQCARIASVIAMASVAVAIPKSSVGGVMPK